MRRLITYLALLLFTNAVFGQLQSSGGTSLFKGKQPGEVITSGISSMLAGATTAVRQFLEASFPLNLMTIFVVIMYAVSQQINKSLKKKKDKEKLLNAKMAVAEKAADFVNKFRKDGTMSNLLSQNTQGVIDPKTYYAYLLSLFTPPEQEAPEILKPFLKLMLGSSKEIAWDRTNGPTQPKNLQKYLTPLMTMLRGGLDLNKIMRLLQPQPGNGNFQQSLMPRLNALFGGSGSAVPMQLSHQQADRSNVQQQLIPLLNTLSGGGDLGRIRPLLQQKPGNGNFQRPVMPLSNVPAGGYSLDRIVGPPQPQLDNVNPEQPLMLPFALHAADRVPLSSFPAGPTLPWSTRPESEVEKALKLGAPSSVFELYKGTVLDGGMKSVNAINSKSVHDSSLAFGDDLPPNFTEGNNTKLYQHNIKVSSSKGYGGDAVDITV